MNTTKKAFFYTIKEPILFGEDTDQIFGLLFVNIASAQRDFVYASDNMVNISVFDNLEKSKLNIIVANHIIKLKSDEITISVNSPPYEGIIELFPLENRNLVNEVIGYMNDRNYTKIAEILDPCTLSSQNVLDNYFKEIPFCPKTDSKFIGQFFEYPNITKDILPASQDILPDSLNIETPASQDILPDSQDILPDSLNIETPASQDILPAPHISPIPDFLRNIETAASPPIRYPTYSQIRSSYVSVRHNIRSYEENLTAYQKRQRNKFVCCIIAIALIFIAVIVLIIHLESNNTSINKNSTINF